MTVRKLQIAGTILCLGLVGISFLSYWWAAAFTVYYFGFACAGVPLVIGSSWWMLRKGQLTLATWRKRLYGVGLLLVTVMYLSISGGWLIGMSDGVPHGRMLVSSGFGVFAVAFVLGFFAKGWQRASLPIATLCCLFLWIFPFALD